MEKNADDLDNRSTVMTANVHRLFANELESVVKLMKDLDENYIEASSEEE